MRLRLSWFLLAMPFACVDVGSDVAPLEIATRHVAGVSVHVVSSGASELPAVLLLHGGRFSSRDWIELGTLALITQEGYRALAIDLPGFGASQPSTLGESEFMRALFRELELDSPIVITPSMSGRYALALLAEEPAAFGALVALAPVAIERHVSALAGVPLPALLIWGSEDQTVPPAQADLLAEALPFARLRILEGAGHPAYFEQPDDFHEELRRFLRGLHGGL